MEEKKIVFYGVEDITPDNKEQVLERQFNNWVFMNSDKVIIEGVEIGKLERGAIAISNNFENDSKGKINVSGIGEGGIPLTKELFLEQEQRKYHRLWGEYQGSVLNMKAVYKIKTYLEYIQFLQRIEILKQEINSRPENKKKIIKGFDTKLTDEQINKLHFQFQAEGFIEAKLDNFKVIFRKMSEVSCFEKVIWKKHKTALREFLAILNMKPTQKIIKELICDEKGNEIIVPKRKGTEFSSHYKDMEKIISPTLKAN